MEIFSIFGSHCISKQVMHCKCLWVCWWCVCNWSITILSLLLYAFLTTNVFHFPFLRLPKHTFCSFVRLFISFPFEIVSWSNENPRWSILRISVFSRRKRRRRNHQTCDAWGACWPKLNAHIPLISHVCRFVQSRERERARARSMDDAVLSHYCCWFWKCLFRFIGAQIQCENGSGIATQLCPIISSHGLDSN